MKKKNKKTDYKRSIKTNFLNEDKRLYQYRKIISVFDNKIYIIKSMILLEDEITKIIKIFHQNLEHIGINRLIIEIEYRGLFINNIAKKTKTIVKNCIICNQNIINKFVKPNNLQINQKSL